MTSESYISTSTNLELHRVKPMKPREAHHMIVPPNWSLVPFDSFLNRWDIVKSSCSHPTLQLLKVAYQMQRRRWSLPYSASGGCCISYIFLLPLTKECYSMPWLTRSSPRRMPHTIHSRSSSWPTNGTLSGFLIFHRQYSICKIPPPQPYLTSMHNRLPLLKLLLSSGCQSYQIICFCWSECCHSSDKNPS
jgi:hypothetical protein